MSSAEESVVQRSSAYEPVIGRTFVPQRTRVRRDGAFAINGRFLTQPLTGVQRYAREVVKALDSLVPVGSAELVAPSGVKDRLSLLNIREVSLGTGTGHLWEQLCLPSDGKPLLNLCNTAPLLGRGGCVCIHDTNVFEVPHSYSARFRLTYKTLHHLLARSSAKISTVSNHSANRIAHHLGLSRKRIVVASNGHEHALGWRPERATTPCADQRPYILLLGSLAPHKNIDRILGLASSIADLGLDIKIVGKASGVFRRQDYRPPPNVVFLGNVMDDDLALLFQNALCLVFPSFSEGFGLPLLEAMVWNCPVVASRIGGLTEVGGDACLYADPREDGEWLSHLKAICGSATLREDLRGRGLERAKSFSWKETAARYIEVMTSLDSRANNGGPA